MFFVVAALALQVAAPPVVSGTVRETGSGAPIVSAVVELSGTRFRALTDEAGRYTLIGVPSGERLIAARAVGFRVETRTIAVQSQGTVQSDFELERLAVPLAAIVVTPSRFSALTDAPVMSATLSREQIETMPQLGEDIYRAITRIPGMASDDISARFWVRGAPNEEVLARLDGVELIEPFHMKDFDGALSILDVANIGQLDLVTGGFTTEFGDRLTGVLDMRTREDRTEGTRTTLGLSITSLRAANRGSFAGGRGHWLASARRGYIDIALKLIGEGDSISPAYYDLFAKVDYRLGERHTLSAHVLRAGDDLDYAEEGDPRLTSSYGSTYAWLGWRLLASSRVTSDAVLSFARQDWNRRFIGNFGPQDTINFRDIKTYEGIGWRHDLTVSATDRVVLKFGYDARSLSAEYDYANLRDRQILRNDSLVTVRDSAATAMNPDGTSLAAWGAIRVRPLTALVVEVGARWDRQAWTGESNVSPRLNLVYDLGRATSVRMAWGDYRQATGIHQVAVADGETAFAPSQRTEHRVIGLEHRMRRGLGIRVEAYERVYTSVRPYYINLIDGSTIFRETSFDRVRVTPSGGRARGVEVLVERRLGGRFDWAMSYTVSQAYDNALGRRIPRQRDQRHALYADLTYAPNPKWRLSAAWQYHTGWPMTQATFRADTVTGGFVVIATEFGELAGQRLPAYHRLDLRASRQWRFRGSTLTLFLDLFNMYDASNPAGYEYDVRYVSGSGQLQVRQVPDKGLPRLPSLGINFEF